MFLLICFPARVLFYMFALMVHFGVGFPCVFSCWGLVILDFLGFRF